MAITIPTYANRQVEGQGLPNARFTADTNLETFGGGDSANGLNRAVKGITDDIAKVANEEALNQARAERAAARAAKEAKAKADQVRLLGERRGLNDWEYANVYDPKTGALQKIGKDSFGLLNDLPQSFDKYIAERSKGLADDDQRLDFQKLAESRRETIVRELQNHIGKQQGIVREAEFDASLESSKERASINLKSIPIETAMMRQLTMQRAQEQGWDSEKTNQELRKNESDLHLRVVSGMLARGKDMDAASHFKSVESRLDPDVATKIAGLVEAGSFRGESQRLSDKILAESGDLELARDAAKQIKDPKLRDEVDQRVRQEFEIRKGQDTINREKVFTDSIKTIEQSKSLDAIPIEQWNQMTPGQKSAARALQRQLTVPGPHKHDEKVYVKYVGLAKNNALANVSEAELIEKVRPNVDDGSWDRVLSLWNSARNAKKGDKKSHAEVKSMFTDEEMVFNAMRSARMGVSDSDTMAEVAKDGKKAEAYRVMRERADTAFMGFFHETGKMPNAEQKKKLLDGLVIHKVFVEKDWAFDPEKETSQISNDEKGRVYVPIKNIPQTEQAAIRKHLEAGGRKITDDKIQRAYGAMLMNDGARVRAILGE